VEEPLGLLQRAPGLHRDGRDHAGAGHEALELGRQVVAPQHALVGGHPRILVRVEAPEVLVGVDHALVPPRAAPNVSAGSVPPYCHCTFITGSSAACTAATTAGSTGSPSHARPWCSSSCERALKSVTGRRGSLAAKAIARRGRVVPSDAATRPAVKNTSRARLGAGCQAGGSAPPSKPEASGAALTTPTPRSSSSGSSSSALTSLSVWWLWRRATSSGTSVRTRFHADMK